MFVNTKWISFYLGVILTVAVSLFSYFYLDHFQSLDTQSHWAFDLFEKIDLRFNDLKYSLAVPEVKNKRTVLVAIDDESIDEVGRWPWSRLHMTELAKKLTSYQVKSLGFDIIFSEPERENRNADEFLANFVEQNQDRVVLGTYSNNLLQTKPYQDYCVNEAFLQNGGKNLIKINPSFVVEDSTDLFEELDWGTFFKSFFITISQTTEQNYLKKLNVQSTKNLTEFQKNFLKSLKTSALFDYCGQWLTPEDPYFTLQNNETLALYSSLFSKQKNLAPEAISKKISTFKAESSLYPVPIYGRWAANTEVIQDKAFYTASFNTKLDSDGLIRRYPLFYRAGNRLGSSFIPSLALQLYLVSTGFRADVKIDQIGSIKKITSFVITDPSQSPEKIVQVLPVDSEGNLLINYYGPRMSLQSVSAKELFSQDLQIQVYQRIPSHSRDVIIKSEKEIKSEFFKDKSIILGATAMALYDLRNTPLDNNFPGPEIHQTVLENLFNQNYLSKPLSEKIYLPILLFIYGVLFSYLLYSQGALRSAGALVTFLGLSFLTDFFLFVNYKIVVSSFFFIGLTFIIFLALLIYKYLSEERKKDEIRNVFSKYVARSVVDELLKDSKNLELGGKKQTLTAYFSDIRGFTSFSEKMDPQTLSQVLNEYLTPMTEIIFRNKGTLDKYMGDAIMAFFGAPLNFPEHAQAACLSALQSQSELEKMNESFKAKGWPKIHIGIGINTGEMSVGNMGSQIVQNYTVMGDSVNLASRLEGATKEYGVKILISEFTLKNLDQSLITRFVDNMRVKGKSEPVKIYELLSTRADFKFQPELDTFHLAIKMYQEKDFTKALSAFRLLAESDLNDTVVQIYISRCEEFFKNPPPANWDGVFDLKTK